MNIEQCMQNLKDEINDNVKHDIDELKERLKEILQKAIQKAVYDYYRGDDEVYGRQYQLIDSVDSEIEGDTLTIFINTDKLDFTTIDGSKDVSEQVPYWINGNKNRGIDPDMGHDNYMGNKFPKTNQFNRYERRGYLDLAVEMIEQEFNLNVEIINNAPDWV